MQKPTDLDLHCLQRQGISGFSRTRVKMPYKIIADKKTKFLVYYFSEKIRLDVICEMSVLQIIYMNCEAIIKCGT